jgi:hypothetical protein
VGVATVLLASGGLGCVAMGPAAGIAQAGAWHWCPGDPPPHGIHPAWDTSVCHDYVISGNHVEEGTPCILPQFQWFMCPPGTTPNPLMTPVPNQGE